MSVQQFDQDQYACDIRIARGTRATSPTCPTPNCMCRAADRGQST